MNTAGRDPLADIITYGVCMEGLTPDEAQRIGDDLGMKAYKCHNSQAEYAQLIAQAQRYYDPVIMKSHIEKVKQLKRIAGRYNDYDTYMQSTREMYPYHILRDISCDTLRRITSQRSLAQMMGANVAAFTDDDTPHIAIIRQPDYRKALTNIPNNTAYICDKISINDTSKYYQSNLLYTDSLIIQSIFAELLCTPGFTNGKEVLLYRPRLLKRIGVPRIIDKHQQKDHIKHIHLKITTMICDFEGEEGTSKITGRICDDRIWHDYPVLSGYYMPACDCYRVRAPYLLKLWQVITNNGKGTDAIIKCVFYPAYGQKTKYTKIHTAARAADELIQAAIATCESDPNHNGIISVLDAMESCPSFLEQYNQLSDTSRRQFLLRIEKAIAQRKYSTDYYTISLQRNNITEYTVNHMTAQDLWTWQIHCNKGGMNNLKTEYT